MPAGHALFRIDGSRQHEPHLHEGEWVVVDTRASGRRVVWGELYLVLQSNGPILWQVNRFTEGTVVGEKGPHARLDPLNIYRGDFKDLRGDCTKIVHLSDGPLSLPQLRADLLGRVVGLFIGPREYADRRSEAAQLEYLTRKAQERERTIDGRAAP